MEDSNLKTLYNSLRRDNYDVPDNYDSFERTLTNDKEARRTLYNSLRRENYDVPDSYESFDRTLFPAEEQAAAPSADAAPAAATGPASPAPSAAVQQAAASGEGTILGDAKLGGAAGGVLGDSVGKASVSGGALGVAGVGGGYEWSYAPSPGASGASPSTGTREASVRPAPAKFTPKEEASLVEEVGRLNTSSEGVDVIPDGRGGFVQKVTSGDKVYYRYPKGDVAEYKLENGVERMVRYRFADGEVREYNANGDGGFKTIHAPHVPHIGDEGHILYQKHDQPFELDRDLISVWNSKIFNNKDNYRDYHSDYAGKSESELRQAISGLVASKSGASEEQLIELANRYDAACLELVARQCGFGSLSEARSHPGKFEWSRFASRVAEKYPSDYTGVMLDASMYHVAADHPGDILFDAAKSESESLWGDMIEGSAPHHTYADIINNLLYFEKDRNNFVTLCMIKARETDMHVDGIIKEELERVVTNISAAAEKGVDIAVEQYKSSLPGWKLPFYTAFGHSTFGQLGVWLGKKAGTWTDEEERLMEGASQKYVKELGGWERFFVRDVGGFVGSLPEILLASWGAEALMPAASAATAGGRILHSTLTMTGVGILSQGASDLNAGQFSGLGQWVGNVAHSAAMGATMGVFGEAARGVMLRPTSKMAVLWNKGAEYAFETAGFTLPEWVSTVYSGVTPEGDPITGDYFWQSAVHNLGVVIAMKGRRNFKNWKPVVNKTDLAQLQAAYPDLYNDVTHNLDMVTRGKGADELSDGAKRQLAQLQDDMATPGKGVSWDTYKKTMNLFGYEVIPPKPSSVRRDGNVVQVLDSGGNVITEKRYINSKEAKTAEGTLHSQIEHDTERTNAQLYDAARTRKLYYDTCSDIADRMSDNKEWRKRGEDGNFLVDENGNYIPDENYRCVTPEDVDAALKDAYDTPENERTQQQVELIATFEADAKQLSSTIPNVKELAQMVCDIYGIKVEQLERVSNLEPSERRKGDKATQAMVLFNDLLNRGVTSGEPVGRVKLRDGETYIDVLNEANPANKDGYYFYKDANGNTQWLSATEVESYEPITSEREQRYGVSRSNSEAKVQGAYDSYVGVAKMYSDEALRQRIDWLLDKYDLKLDDEGNVLRKRGSRRGEAGYDERGMRSDDADLLKIQAFLKVLTDRAANRPKPYATEVERAERVRQWGERNGVTYDTEYLLEHPLELDELVKEMESGEVTAPDADVRQSPTMPANTATTPTPLTDDAALAPTSVEVGGRYEVADRDGVHDIEVVGDYGGAYGDGFLEVRIDGAEETVPLRREDLEKLLDINSGEAGVQSGEDEVALTTPQTEPMAQTETRPEPETGTPALTGDGGAAAQGTEPMPLQKDGNPDFAAATPERGRQYIYDETGLDKSEADAYVVANLAAAEKDLDNIKNKPPKMGTNLVKYKNEKTDWESRMRGAQAAVDYWNQVKAIEQAREAQAAAERKAKDAEVIAQAQAEEQARQAAEVAKQQEQDERGAGAVHPAIAEKWNNAPKIEGYKDEVVLANGERVPGTYYLVESGAVTPSHNASREFEKYEGFPVDENGNTINDRDYERDKDAQNITRSIADKYDSRALQTPVIVSKDGVVLSGNGRTMAGELAASNNTDGAYIEHLKNYGRKYGFSPEQVSSMQHPRAVFVPDTEMPYTTETFAKFNAQEMKGQSKTEQAVKLGKVVDDATFNQIVRAINDHETLGDFYNNTRAATEAINALRNAGALNNMQYAEMFDGDAVSSTGRQIIENMLIGKAFEGNPDVIRMLTEYKGFRQSVVTALNEISTNVALGKDYSLENELAQAIELAYKARKAGFKENEPVSPYATQLNLFPFEDGETVADYNNAAVLLLADLLNDKRPTLLKKKLQDYNQQSAESAAGQMDIFAGGVKEKKEIIKTVLNTLHNGEREETQRPEQRGTVADERGGEASLQEDGAAGQPEQGNAATGQGDMAQAEVTAPLSDEVNEFEKPFVLSSDGTTTFGEVTEDSGLVAAPIKLSLGENVVDENGANHGYGLLHIEASHGEQIRAAGFSSVEEFVETVAKNYDTIREGGIIADNQTYLLEISDEHNNTLFIQLSRDGSYWNINSAGIFKKKYSRRKPEVFTRPALKPETNTDFSGVDSGLLSGVTAPAGNSPQTSVGKVSAKDSDLQAKVEKNVENERKSNIQGLESYSEDELRVIVEEHVRSAIADADMDAEITGIRFIGSRTTGTARADSDLDVLVEYQGTAREDSLFNVLNDEDNRLVIDGITVDINPITPGKSGTIEEFMRRNAGYKKETTVQEQIALAEQQTETSPSEAQKEAGNYKKGHVKIDGFDISIEQPKGSVRSGVDSSGKSWRQKMNNTYGYIRGTEGVDGDHIDVFLSDDPSQGDVFVVDQVNKDGSFDEHKVMYGFNSEEEAREAYLSNYEDGWQGLGAITAVSKDEFKKWIGSSHRKTKPFAEYKNVKVEGEQAGTMRQPTGQTVDGDIARFHKETDSSGRTAIDEANYNVDDLVAPLLVDGKKSHIGITHIVPDDINEPTYTRAYYDYAHLIDPKTNKGWQAVGDKIDEWNASHKKDEQGFDDGDAPQVRFPSVDAALKFAEWFEASISHQEQRGAGGVLPSAEEVALRDGLVEVLRGAGIEVVTDEAEGQRVLDAANGHVQAMGSRVNKRMAEIDALLKGREMNKLQQAVVDVFSGKKDNVPIDIERADGNRRVIMRQGNEQGAGTKHSVFGHYGTTRGVISADDILLVPEVLIKGERTEKQRGKSTIVEYRHTDENGTRFTVLTESKDKGEVFNDFYSNKKASNQIPQRPNGDTPESARSNDSDANLLAKIQKVADKASVEDEKTGADGEVSTHSDATQANPTFSREDLGAVLSDAKIQQIVDTSKDLPENSQYFRTGSGEVYGFVRDGKIYIDPRVASAETPVHEYSHLWADALKRANPEAWERLKETMLGEKDVLEHVKRLYPELEGDELLAEVFSHYSGKRGAEQLRADMEREMKNAEDVFAKARVARVFDIIRRVLSRFWQMARDLFAGKNSMLNGMRAEDFADMAMNDMLSGFDPRGVEKEIALNETHYHKVTDKAELERLNNEPTVVRYRAMQMIDGKLYPPMSAEVKGELREPTEIGVWERSDERPDLVDKNGKFKLQKGKRFKENKEGQGDTPAAYNPYFHTSTSMMNDQFTAAYVRPELVVVKVEIPESELSSGYKAEKAKDAVGNIPWHSGPVNSALPKERQRTVTLSRYCKVTGVVPDAEVADAIARQLDGLDVAVPYNVVTPNVRAELEARGVKISATPSGSVTRDINGELINRGEAMVANEGEVLYEPSARTTGPDIEIVNSRFNEELQKQIDGTLPKGHVYKLGKPSAILRSAGIPELPIELVASRLVDKSMQENHPYDLSEVEDLPQSIHTPLAVFRSATHIGSYVILTELRHGNRNFVAAIETNRQLGKLLVNSIRSVHPRNGMNVVNWINEGLAEYVHPEFEDKWLTPFKNELRSKPQYNSADVRTQLKDAAKIVKDFENPSIGAEKVTRERGFSYRSGSGDVIKFESHAEQLSLFCGVEQSNKRVIEQAKREERAKAVAAMSDAELLKEMQRDIDELDKTGRGDWGVQTLCSQEYDERHIKEYNAECDAVRKMLEENNVDVEQAEQMLLDAIYTWREGYATPDRTKLLAQFDTINDYYGELEERGLRNEESETDARNTETSPTLDERAAAEQSPTMPATTETSPTPKRGGFDPSAIKLRKLNTGETCHVERRYVESGGFDFTGSERVESDADLAYIFRNLETSSIENSFLVLIKNGKATILHIGMGGYSMTPGHIGAGILAASQLKPDAVIFVHNHPSGTLAPSLQDVAMQEKCKKMFGADKVREAIIIDITSGKYSTYDLSTYDTKEKERPRSVENEVPYKTFSFSKQVFDKDYVPEATFQITDANKAAEFISAHRLGERDKFSLIVLNRQKRVTGNIFLPWTTLDGVDINKAADEIAKFIHQMGGESGILYGSGSISRSTLAPLSRAIRDRDVYLDDFINVEGRSAQVEGVMEAGVEYEPTARNTGLANEDALENVAETNKIVEDLPQLWGVRKDFGTYHAIDSEEALENLISRTGLSKKDAEELRDAYYDKDVPGCGSPERDMVILFTEKLTSKAKLANIASHETFHVAYKYLERGEHNRFNNAILEWFRNQSWGDKFIEALHQSYDPSTWATETMAYFVGHEVEKHGWDKFISGEIDYGNEEINNFVSRFKNIITNGNISQISGESRRKALSNDERAGQRGNQPRGRGYDERPGDEGWRRANSSLVEEEVPYGQVEDTGISDEELESFDAGKFTFAESIANGLVGLAAKNAADNQLRLNAMREFGGNLAKLRKLMNKQKAYDKATVNDIIRLSRMVMGSGFFKDMSAYEVKRLLAAIKRGVGADDLTPIANNVVDMLVQHQLRESKNMLHKLMQVRGRKVDARGVEVQAGLDIDGQRMMSALKDGMELGETGIATRITDCEDRLVSEDEVIRKNAMSEYQGLMLAKEWHDNIRASKEEENGLPTSGTHSLTSLK